MKRLIITTLLLVGCATDDAIKISNSTADANARIAEAKYAADAARYQAEADIKKYELRYQNLKKPDVKAVCNGNCTVEVNNLRDNKSGNNHQIQRAKGKDQIAYIPTPKITTGMDVLNSNTQGFWGFLNKHFGTVAMIYGAKSIVETITENVGTKYGSGAVVGDGNIDKSGNLGNIAQGDLQIGDRTDIADSYNTPTTSTDSFNTPTNNANSFNQPISASYNQPQTTETTTNTNSGNDNSNQGNPTTTTTNPQAIPLLTL